MSWTIILSWTICYSMKYCNIANYAAQEKLYHFINNEIK